MMFYTEGVDKLFHVEQLEVFNQICCFQLYSKTKDIRIDIKY